MFVVDALAGAGRGGDVEGACGADGDTSGVDSGVLACGEGGANEVAGGEAVDVLDAGKSQAGEPVPVGAGSAVDAAAGGPDHQDAARPPGHLPEFADVQGVQGVGLRRVRAGAVPLGTPTRTGGHGQSGRGQRPPQRPAGGVDRRGVPERGLGLLEVRRSSR